MAIGHYTGFIVLFYDLFHIFLTMIYDDDSDVDNAADYDEVKPRH